MALLERKDVCEIITIEDDKAFREFAASNPTGLTLSAEEYGEQNQIVFKSDGAHFAKWIRLNNPAIAMTYDENKPRLTLRDNDIWLPLVFLASDITLPIYLNLVSNFLYEKMRGFLKGETIYVHLSAEYEDQASKKIKRFNFDGDTASLEKAIKRFDLNQFFNEE